MAAILEAFMDTTRQCYCGPSMVIFGAGPLIGHNESRAAERQETFRVLLEAWRESKPTVE